MMMLQAEAGNYNNSEWVLENLMAVVHNEAAPPILLPPHTHHLNYNYNYTPMQLQTTTGLNPSSFLHHQFPSPVHLHLQQQQQQQETSPPEMISHSAGPTNESSYNVILKKQNHNASERERRKKLNNLYSSLRSLLPPTHHHMKKKKQSIPTTVSRVLKYVPELKHQLHQLIQHKQRLLSTTAHITETRLLEGGGHNKTSCRFNTAADTHEAAAAAAVCVTVMINSTSAGDNEEVVVQISQLLIKDNMVPLSEIIRVLEKHGFILTNLSSLLVPPSTHLFYALHLQAGRNTLLLPVECIESFLRDKILSLLPLHPPY